ncbi:MAG: hypothetical protein OXC26_07535 [Albidovulum sp.]|nr:hypothetical protein [Albidovulum sp.]
MKRLRTEINRATEELAPVREEPARATLKGRRWPNPVDVSPRERAERLANAVLPGA